MRRQAPLIVGAGPAGCAAALALAKGGVRARIVERQRETGNALCGGFLSWQTVRKLESLGVGDLSAHPIMRVRVCAGRHQAESALPAPAVGVSRHRLDTMMQRAVAAAKVPLDRGVTVTHWSPGVLTTESGDLPVESLFLASGKHDIRGLGRPRTDPDPTLGLRVRLAPHPALTQMLAGHIELHLFDGGYAGLLLQEDGSANLCLAVHKARLGEAGGTPMTLLTALARDHPVLAARLAFLDTTAPVDAIAAVPYGWRAKTTMAGLFRLGDQAAVIPSLAGEGLGIAIASGMAAAHAWVRHGAAGAERYQRDFARRAQRPVEAARFLWRQGERPRTAALAIRCLKVMPRLAGLAARLTRIGD